MRRLVKIRSRRPHNGAHSAPARERRRVAGTPRATEPGCRAEPPPWLERRLRVVPSRGYDAAMRALLVEDDATIAEFVARGLREAGFAVDCADDGEAALEGILQHPYDVAVIDLMLPRRDGLSVIDEMRRRRITTPVLILSARRTVDDRVKGLQAGGDDYLTKPFAFAELLARVQALVRRATRTPEPTTLSVDGLVLDLLSRRVTRNGKPIELRPREFALLEYLMRNPGRVVSKTMILSHVWEYSFDPQTNIVDVLVSRLREKVDRPFDQKLLHTVRGVGYVLREEAS
jgi:two-component system, OmpR family, response regulator